MRIHRLGVALFAAVAALAGSASAATLSVGDKAPPLTVGKWVKGEPVKGFENGKLYVVEFWATWCGPCKTSIPHLTKMAKANPEVTFVGASVWENDDAAVEPFVAEMGDKMDYHVATDDKSTNETGAMAAGWMQAAGQNGIPTAFVVNKEGVIAWIGHPMELEPVLKKIVAGQYDMDAAKKETAERVKKAEAVQKIQSEFQEKVGPALQSQDWDGAGKAIDEFIVAHPEVKDQLIGVKFGVMVQGKQWDQAYATADQLAEANNDNAEELNKLAWYIVDDKAVEKRDLDRALKYATRASELTKNENGAILDTVARIHFEKGEIEKAIEVQTKAVALADGQTKAELEKSLERYKAALLK